MRNTTTQRQISRVYDILGARILRLQDQLSDLPADDGQRAVLIAILTELDDLKRKFAEILDNAD
ncbi:MAG: hypothetical protein GXY42_03945 [Desulfovibrionales bacterium]|nr:hypothetical protein [Desulfovibrionales bacterium]